MRSFLKDLWLMVRHDREAAIIVGMLLAYLQSPDSIRRVGEPVAFALYAELATWEAPAVNPVFGAIHPNWGKTEHLIGDLDDPARAENAEARLERRRNFLHSRDIILRALDDATLSAKEEGGVSQYRRLVRLALGMNRPPETGFWIRLHDEHPDEDRRAILMELLCAEGSEDWLRLRTRPELSDRLVAAAYRGLDRAFSEGQHPFDRLMPDLISRLRMELIGVPVSDDLECPGPAAVLIRIQGRDALGTLCLEGVLDPENPRLAENLRAMVEAEMLLPLSVHEILLQNLREVPSGEPIEKDPLTPAVAMLGLRGDEASRERLRKLRDDERARLGAEQGLALMERANEKN